MDLMISVTMKQTLNAVVPVDLFLSLLARFLKWAKI